MRAAVGMAPETNKEEEKMYRIGLIGSENSHARAFAKVFSQDPAFSDLVVTAVCGNEGRETRPLRSPKL